MEKLLLASNSPRRSALFALFGWQFNVKPADVDETQLPADTPAAYVKRLAHEKATAIAQTFNGWVIGADTIVVDGETLLGKPENRNEACQMLWQLRGRIHQVYTGIALVNWETEQSFHSVCCTHVSMRKYTEDEVDAYIATGDPLDKAGAYAIQHTGFHPVVDMKGCYASVMGLPLCHLMVGFRYMGVSVPGDVPSKCQTYLDYDCPVSEQILSTNPFMPGDG